MRERRDRVKIPPGTTRARRLCGLPTEAALMLACLGLILFLSLRSLWVLLILVPAWGFVKYQSLKDQSFLKAMVSQILYAKRYEP